MYKGEKITQAKRLAIKCWNNPAVFSCAEKLTVNRPTIPVGIEGATPFSALQIIFLLVDRILYLPMTKTSKVYRTKQGALQEPFQ